MKKIMVLMIVMMLAIALSAIAYAYAPGDKVIGGSRAGWAMCESSSVRLDSIAVQPK